MLWDLKSGLPCLCAWLCPSKSVSCLLLVCVVFSPLALKMNLHFRLVSICLLSFVFAEEDSFQVLNLALVSCVGLYLLSLNWEKVQSRNKGSW